MKRALYWLVFRIEIPDQNAEFAADEGLGLTAIIVMSGLWVLVGARLVAAPKMRLADWCWLGFVVLVWSSYTLRIKRLALDQAVAPRLSPFAQGVRAVASGVWVVVVSGPLTHALLQDWHTTSIMVGTLAVMTMLTALPVEKNS
ncbi:hypothetical protein ACFQ5J_13225 [Lacticaseibacillus baoqingensis]|uniref:Uncharacterized protein n=1 Tax=Lacticaseibacillus baoqingensis TaxID=2486013 RepID=A0ABW4EAY7_9LACO|nr:hypothetical protein [Lacticaseibacillus baoqingensis]